MTSTNWERPTSINPIPDFTTGFASPDGQRSNIDTIYEKIYERFKALKQHSTKSSRKY